MMNHPFKPLEIDQKRRVAASLGHYEPSSEHWTTAAVTLWLHFCHEIGVKPAEAGVAQSDAYRRVLRRWAPIVAKHSPRLMELSAERTYAPKIAPLSNQIHNKAIQARARAFSGELQPLALISE